MEFFFKSAFYVNSERVIISTFRVVLQLFKFAATFWSVGMVLYIDSAGCLPSLYSLISCWRWLPLLVSGLVSPCICCDGAYNVNVSQCVCRCALSGTVNNIVVDCLIHVVSSYEVVEDVTC